MFRLPFKGTVKEKLQKCLIKIFQLMDFALFFASFIGILLAAELFTNAVEDIGDHLDLSHGVVGSLLAAIGTALPETLVPIAALLFGKPEVKSHIANGAILGAPFMLATLGFFVIGLAAAMRWDWIVKTDTYLIKRDLIFFGLLFPPAVLLGLFKSPEWLRLVFGILLLIGYGYYVYHVFKEGGEEVESEGDLHFSKYLKMPKHLATSIIQLISSLLVLLISVEVFVHALQILSQKLGIAPLVFSLLVSPVATELPEKFNSFFWSLKGKYELAFGNITGAMVFQSAIPVSMGLIFTDWNIGKEGLISGLIALSGALLVLYQIKLKKAIYSPLLWLNGALYILYVFLVLS
jgi:cation:H+ antiporter